MSRPITINETLNLYPTGIDTSQSSYSTASNNANAETDTDSTTYSTINLTTGSQVSSYVTYTFNITDDDIPAGATINSVSCQIKARVSSTSYIATAVAQLYANTTAKGGTANFRSNASPPSTVEISNTGSWTVAELKTARIRYTATRGTSNTTRSASMNIYGTDLDITYTFNGTAYTITATSNMSGYTITPDSQEVLGGSSAELSIAGSGSGLIVTDNGVDVTNQLVQEASTGTDTIVPSGYTNLSSGVTINSSYPIADAYNDADDSTDYCRLDFSTSTTGYIELTFNIPTIPSGATLTSISARARLRVSSTSRMGSRVCRLYTGSTAKGNNVDFTSTATGGAVVTLTPGSWTISELSNLRMRIGATSTSSTSSKYIYIYGADVTISYELAGNFYTYTITSIAADHTVIVGTASSGPKFYVKINGIWTQVSKIYEKVNGSWVEQSNSTWATLFDTNTNYRKMS